MALSTATLNALDSALHGTGNSEELGTLFAATPGTSKANAAVVTDANGNILINGQLYQSFKDTITAQHTSPSQSTATKMTAMINRITTVTAAGDAVALPPSVAGMEIQVINHGANAVQVYGDNGAGDKINDVATGTGVSQMIGSSVVYSCVTAGNWYAEGIGTGYSGSLPTFSFQDGVTANHTSPSQSTATQLTGSICRVSTSTAQGDGVALPTSAAGLEVVVMNVSTNAIQVYGNNTEAATINGITTATGISLGVNQVANFICTAAGNWVVQLNASTQPGLVALSGTADAIPPHVSHTYVVTKAGVDAMTLAAPTATTDDGIIITITSNTANAHTITATNLLQTGGTAVSVLTFAAHAGASVTLMAYQGKWNIISNNLVALTS